MQIILLTILVADTKTNLISTLLDGLANSALVDPVINSQEIFGLLPPAKWMTVDTAYEAKEL